LCGRLSQVHEWALILTTYEMLAPMTDEPIVLGGRAGKWYNQLLLVLFWGGGELAEPYASII